MLRKWLSLISLLAIIGAVLPFASAQSDPLAPEGAAGQVYYAPFNVDITLDGDTADWEGVQRVALSQNNHAVIFAAAANDEYLFLLGDVTDPNIITGQHEANYWNEDSVEFYLNGTGDSTLRSYQPGVAQITVPALNKDLAEGEAPVLGGVQGNMVNAQVKVVGTDHGYLVEMAVPLKNDVWEITPAHGTAIGFQVHLNGANTANRDTKIIWSAYDTNDQSYTNPSLFGHLIFYEIGQTDMPEPPVAVVDRPELPPVPQQALYHASSFSPDVRVLDLMARMSLDEKIAQMTLVEKNSLQADDLAIYGLGGVLSGGGGYPAGNNTPEGWAEMVNGYQEIALTSRLGIPIIYGVDAVHGHNNVVGTVIFPHNIGMGATRNPELVEQACRITALEIIATGIYWDYTPVLAVVHDPRWGRYYEGYSENSDLVTELGTACVRGLQGDDLSDELSALATIKHYIGDGSTTWGSSTTGDYQIDQGVTEMDEATLRETLLPPYINAIENGAQSLMISYSSWGGMKMHAQSYLINDVLKGELGFEGFVVSDWAGMDQISPDDYYNAIVTSVNAGVDMNMVPYDYFRFMDTLKQAVNNGDVSIERIDDAVERILRVKFAMGLFEHPYSNEELLAQVGSEEHRAVARQAVAESQVLLKNDGDVLPLAPETATIFVAGEAADDIGIQSGGWTIEWQGETGDITEGTTILEGIQNTVGADTEIVYSEDGEDFEGNAEIGIVVVGERPYAEGRGDDPDLTLSNEDLDVIEATRAQVDKLVVIIVSGRPLIITDEIAEWDAVVAAWLPGTEGQGVADVLFGVQPFTGTLPVTWFASVDQLPLENFLQSGEEPLFPFGHGLTTD